MSTLDDRVENCKRTYFIVRIVLSIIPDKITKHYTLEKLPMKRSKITEIIDSFIINEVEYRKFVSSFVQTNRYTNESIYVLSLSIHFQLKMLSVNLQRQRANLN